MNLGKHLLKIVVVSRDGTLSVAAHLAEMRAWLAERNITPRELVHRPYLELQNRIPRNV